jgi:hypothetical protein
MSKIRVDYSDGTVSSLQRREYVQAPSVANRASGSSYSSFNGSVDSSYSVSQPAHQLKTKTSTQPVNKVSNYYLTNDEKKLLAQKAADFSEPGIVPYDVIEDFLYVLCYIDDYDTMKFVSIVTGVIGLDNPSILRDPFNILNLPDLNKIGYLANGLASLTKQIDQAKFTQATSAQDTEDSAYSALKKASSSLSEAGQTISSFPGVGQFGSALTGVTSVVTAIEGLVATFSSPGTTQTKIGQLSSVLSQIGTLTQNIQSVLNVGGQQNVTSLFPLVDQVNNIVQTVNRLTDSVNTLKEVASSDSYPNAKVGGINSKLNSIFNSVTNIASEFTSVTSKISSIASPGNVGKPASILLNLTGSSTVSPAITETVLGQRMPTNVLANNPMMVAASNLGKVLFGEAMIPIVTIDQTFKRPIGNYKSPSSGAGTASFKMQNFASMGGSVSPEQFISKVVYNVSSIASGSFLSSMISQQASQVVSILGASATSLIEPRRSDNAIPMMIAIATMLSNDSGSTFPTSVFSEGWKVAASVANDLQKYNPDYLKQIQTTA